MFTSANLQMTTKPTVLQSGSISNILVTPFHNFCDLPVLRCLPPRSLVLSPLSRDPVSKSPCDACAPRKPILKTQRIFLAGASAAREKCC